jgi:hypothetical protein
MSIKTVVAGTNAAVAVTTALSASRSSTGSAPPTMSAPVVSSKTVPRPSALVYELVPKLRARLHRPCAGTGPTTVMLIAGFNGDRGSWAAIESTVSQTTGVCSYDRFGDDSRDTGPGLADLREGSYGPRRAARVSWQTGSVYHRRSIARRPRGDHLRLHVPDRNARTARARRQPARMEGGAAPCPTASDPAHVFGALCAEQSTPANDGEHLDAPTACAEVATITSLKAFLMIAVTADHHSFPGSPPLKTSRSTTCGTWAAHTGCHSLRRQLISVDHASHNVQIDRPDVDLDKIHELLP